jgi:hypothetical protein
MMTPESISQISAFSDVKEYIESFPSELWVLVEIAGTDQVYVDLAVANATAGLQGDQSTWFDFVPGAPRIAASEAAIQVEMDALAAQLASMTTLFTAVRTAQANLITTHGSIVADIDLFRQSSKKVDQDTENVLAQEILVNNLAKSSIESTTSTIQATAITNSSIAQSIISTQLQCKNLAISLYALETGVCDVTSKGYNTVWICLLIVAFNSLLIMPLYAANVNRIGRAARLDEEARRPEREDLERGERDIEKQPLEEPPYEDEIDENAALEEEDAPSPYRPNEDEEAPEYESPDREGFEDEEEYGNVAADVDEQEQDEDGHEEDVEEMAEDDQGIDGELDQEPVDEFGQEIDEEVEQDQDAEIQDFSNLQEADGEDVQDESNLEHGDVDQDAGPEEDDLMGPEVVEEALIDMGTENSVALDEGEQLDEAVDGQDSGDALYENHAVGQEEVEESHQEAGSIENQAEVQQENQVDEVSEEFFQGVSQVEEHIHETYVRSEMQLDMEDTGPSGTPPNEQVAQEHLREVPHDTTRSEMQLDLSSETGPNRTPPNQEEAAEMQVEEYDEEVRSSGPPPDGQDVLRESSVEFWGTTRHWN